MMQNAEIRETLMIGASGVLPTPELVVSVESVLQRYYCVNTDVPFLFTLRNNSISKHYLQQSMYYAEIRLYTADGTEIQDVLQVKNDNPFPTATTQTSPHRRIPIQLDEHTTLTLKFNQIITNVFLKINVYLNQTGTENEAVLSSWQASAPVSITSMQLVLNDAFEGNYDDLEKRLFYNAKGGKDKAIRFEITIKDQHQQDVFLHDVEIKPILLYDDGKYTKVTNQEILKYEAGADNRVRLIHGRVDVRLRINQVSAKHLNHRFCVAFVPVTHTDIAPGYSAGIEVRSKLNTHQLQRKSSSQLEMMASSTSLHDSDDSSDSPPKKKRKSTSEAHQDITSPMTGNDIEVAQQVKQLQEDVKIMMNTMRLMYTQLSSMLEGNQGYPCPEMKRLIDDGFLAIHTKHDTIIQLFQNLQKCLHIDMNNNKSNDVIDAASALSQLSNQSRDINTLPPQHVASSSSSSSSSSPTSSSNILSTVSYYYMYIVFCAFIHIICIHYIDICKKAQSICHFIRSHCVFGSAILGISCASI